MAGAAPDPLERYEMPDPYAVPELTFAQEVDRETQRVLREIEAYTYLGNDFDVPLPADYAPPAVEPDPDYIPPKNFVDARQRVLAVREQLESYRKRIEDYAAETRGLLPMDERSTGEILERANTIARARRDILGNLEQIEEAEKQLAEAEQAGNEDPGFWQGALSVASDALGIAEPVLNLLGAWQENLAGFLSLAPQAVGRMPDVTPDGKLIPESDQAWVDVPWWQHLPPAGLVAGLIDANAPIRQRGRQFNIDTSRKMSALEDSIMTTPLLGHVYGYATPMGAGPKVAAEITGYHEDDIRDLRNRLALEITTDPLLLLDIGPITQVGKLRELSRVGAGVLDKAALKKTLDELPELRRALGSADEAFDAASRGDIVTRLRIRGASADEAAELAKRFDTERVRNLTNLRQLASNDPAEFAKIGREALDPARATTKAQRLAHARQVDYLNRIHEFGRATDKNFVDPIIGRSWYEQAMIGQRLAAMQPIIQRFGDKPWLQNTVRYGSRPWMAITGTSLKHDISDKAELLELYYMQQLRRMDMGAEFHRYEADVAKRAANVLNGMNEQQALQVQEAAVPLIEKIKRGKRMVEAGKAFPDDDGLANAAYQYAKWYEFDAGTARAIENRFNFRVAELSGDLGYFGREFSDELQAKIFNNKRARDWLWGEKARRGLDSISTAWLGYEKQRKYKDLDFFESERELRDGLRRAGLNIADDEVLWKRDGFDVLSKRLQRSRDIAERRGLVYGWVDAAGKADPVLLDTAKGILDEMGAVRVARAAESVAEAGAKVDAATEARAGFEAGRGAVRQAGKAAAREAEAAPQAAQAAADIGSAPKPSRARNAVDAFDIGLRGDALPDEFASASALHVRPRGLGAVPGMPGTSQAATYYRWGREIAEARASGKPLTQYQQRVAKAVEDARATMPAQAAADIGSAPKDLRASLKVEKDLRKMFPGAEGVADDAEDAMRGMAQAVSERVTKQAPEVEEVVGFHGTVKDFDAIDINAPRIAIMDKPGRGQVRGAFFSPDPDVGANYIAATFPNVAKQLGKQPQLIGWKNLEDDFAAAGLSADKWASRVADRVFGKQSKVFAWVREAVARVIGKAPKGVTIHTAKKVGGGRVFEIDASQRGFLVDLLRRAASEQDGIRKLGISITKHGGGVRPRIIKQSLRGKSIDLVDPHKWPAPLVAAVRSGTHSDDKRAFRTLIKAQRDGRFSALNTIERSPALNKWLDANGYQIVKKPEFDDITGDFSYWVRDQEALVPAGQEGTILSRDAQRRANEATERFYAAYQGATNTKEYRAAVRAYEQELKQIVPPALVKDFAKRAEQALKQLDRLETAQAAVAKPVAAAVRKQESAALKNLEKAQERMANADVAAMSPEAKAQWVQSTLTGQGVKPAPGNVSALEVMQKSKIPMPDDLDELARLHVTEFTPNQAEEFKRLHDKLYWKDMQPEHILDNIAKVVIDYPKAVFQGTVLSRWASLSKDLIGNAVNLAMNPRTIPYFTKALRDAWKASRAGEYADDVAELQAIGVLRTSRQEVLEGGSDIARLIPGQVGLAAERVGKMGPVAGSIKTLDKAVKRAAKAVGINLKEGKHLAEGIAGYRDFKLQARQIFEEAGRIATYREALSRGYSKLEAVEEVYKWWGKFDELSKLEKTVLNRILFFWSWMVRSVPVALRHLIEHPVRSKMVLSLLAGDVVDDEKMPPWLRRMGGWVLGDDGNGKVRAMSTLGSSWFSPLFSALQGEAANRMMNGQPWEAAQGAFKDVVRSAPPHVQGAIEYATEYDLFTQKPWWQDRNAKVGSNAKAPTALWWFYGDKGDTAVAKTLGLKATGRSGEPQYLTMDPRWSWFFGMMPGVETSLSDVSAFFRPTATSEIVPEIDIIKGSARLVGVPIYDVPIETGRRQLREFQQALLREGDRQVAGTFSTFASRLSLSNNTTRGRQLATFKEMQRKHGMEQLGMSAAQAERYALNQMARQYPDEFRLLDLQYRLDRWGEYADRSEKGAAELKESLQSRIELLQRRGMVDRAAKEELQRTLEMYKSLGLSAVKKEPERPVFRRREFEAKYAERKKALRSFEWDR